MKYNKITLIDQTGLTGEAIETLRQFSAEPISVYATNPDTKEEIINRISTSDCVLVSWNTELSRDILEKSPNVKYIGMCCSLYDETSSNVDIGYAREHQIMVKGVKDYGDEGVVEYIIAELIRLVKGLGNLQWKEEPVELTNRKIGIIGMGKTGRMLADRAQAFNMDVYYFNRTRKEDAEKAGIKFLPLNILLKETEIISLHLPKNTFILGAEEFELLGSGKILINTSLGLTFQKSAFFNWITRPGNFAIIDADGIGPFASELNAYKNIISTKVVSGWTKEARERLSKKVIENIKQSMYD